MIINGLVPPMPSLQTAGFGYVPGLEGPSCVAWPDYPVEPGVDHEERLRFASDSFSSSSSSGGASGVSGTPPASGSDSDDRYALTNGILAIEAKGVGAELISLRSEKTGLEYMWQGDAWPKHSPVLFPIVGKLKDDRYTYKGKEYAMKQHGLARTRPFEFVRRTPESILFRLRYDEETLTVYPFMFELQIAYLLQGELLRVLYNVRNLGDDAMLFSIGAHPGFRCPLQAGESYEDYSLVLDEARTVPRHFLEDGLVPPGTEPFFEGQSELPLSRDMFDRDAIVLKGIDFERMALLNTDTGHGVTMTMAGFPYFGIWAKPGADFVCLEPWFGVGDSVNSSGRLEEKEGIVPLEAGGEFTASYTIRPS